MWMRSKPFVFFVAALGTLAIVHISALTFFLYWTYLWLDIPLHALGGVVVALGLLTFAGAYTHGRFSLGLLPTLGGVFAVGILWEIFELVSALAGAETNYIGDTILDLIMDLMGGALGYWSVSSNAPRTRESSQVA